MKLDTWPNLVAMFFSQAEKYGDKPFLWRKQDGVYVAMSWRQAADEVRGLLARNGRRRAAVVRQVVAGGDDGAHPS